MRFMIGDEDRSLPIGGDWNSAKKRIDNKSNTNSREYNTNEFTNNNEYSESTVLTNHAKYNNISHAKFLRINAGHNSTLLIIGVCILFLSLIIQFANEMDALQIMKGEFDEHPGETSGIFFGRISECENILSEICIEQLHERNLNVQRIKMVSYGMQIFAWPLIIYGLQRINQRTKNEH